ncbi:MAG: hypothetical protein K5663_07455 [Clostridiales bacterium]|nr:hypothetical protein [Clostridiales bacterium]
MTKGIRELEIHNRYLRKRPDLVLFGPAGERLWADALMRAPGFMGCVDFIHKMNFPLLFTVRIRGSRDWDMPSAACLWRPWEGELKYEGAGVRLSEKKTISRDDVALSLQTWENTSDRPVTLELLFAGGAKQGEIYRFPACTHGLNVIMAGREDKAFSGGEYALKPGEKRQFLFAAAVGLSGEEDGVLARLEGVFALPAQEAYSKAVASQTKWYEGLPEFECSDPFIQRCFYYRMYILRSNMAKPDAGLLRHQTLYEGRSHRAAKTPCAPKGWEFSRLIPLSVPHAIKDLMWLDKQEDCRQTFWSLTDSVNEYGAFSVCAADEKGKEYTNYAAWALYNYHLVYGDTEFIRKVLPAFKRDTLSVFGRHKGENDSLQICYAHQLTGKEYQPGYWYFGGFPDRVKGTKDGYTPLKRVDSSVYMYLNCLGLTRLCEKTGDADAQTFARMAEDIKTQVLSKMWDEKDGCFYDLHYLTEEKARVKHIVSVYPLWADMTEERHLSQLYRLFSPDNFLAGSGFASTAKDCPVYSPCGGWKGDYFKGRDGCMWNGPSWPYTTCIALDAAASQSEKHGHSFDLLFGGIFKQYTMQHFRGGDINQPYLVEFYDAETGEPLSDETDYNHSFYIDLVIRHIAGIQPREGGFVFSPLEAGLEHFSLKGIKLLGHTLEVEYSARTGHILRVDGEETIRLGPGERGGFVPLEAS